LEVIAEGKPEAAAGFDEVFEGGDGLCGGRGGIEEKDGGIVAEVFAPSGLGIAQGEAGLGHLGEGHFDEIGLVGLSIGGGGAVDEEEVQYPPGAQPEGLGVVLGESVWGEAYFHLMAHVRAKGGGEGFTGAGMGGQVHEGFGEGLAVEAQLYFHVLLWGRAKILKGSVKIEVSPLSC